MTLTMVGRLQPLDEKFAIVDANGRPTLYFTRWAQQRQIDIGEAVTAARALEIVQEFLTAHPLIAGNGIDLAPSGDIGADVTISADVQAILDQITTTHGSILYRSASAWAALAPGTAGEFLQTGGAGADPAWAAGGGGGSLAWTLIAATTIVGNPTFLEFDLTGYNEIFGFASAVTTTATSRRSWQVSTNGGVSWLTGATDYAAYSSSGAISNTQLILGTDTDSALARNTLLELTLDNPRMFKILNRNLLSNIVTGAAAKINRLRFGASNTVTLGTTTLTGGVVSVWGR
jgi:hypothetical protein